MAAIEMECWQNTESEAKPRLQVANRGNTFIIIILYGVWPTLPLSGAEQG